MNAPKFQIGDWVIVRFHGVIEGERVHVDKKLFVLGISRCLKGNFSTIIDPEWRYQLCDSPPDKEGHCGTIRECKETVVQPMDPLINEMKKVVQ